MHNSKDTVKNLRKIRDQISNEIKDMSFEEERAYLDELLSGEKTSSPDNNIAVTGIEMVKHKD